MFNVSNMLHTFSMYDYIIANDRDVLVYHDHLELMVHVSATHDEDFHAVAGDETFDGNVQLEKIFYSTKVWPYFRFGFTIVTLMPNDRIWTIVNHSSTTKNSSGTCVPWQHRCFCFTIFLHLK